MWDIQEIIIESESKGPILGGEAFVNDNADISVVLENGDRFVATFFTYQNIEFLRSKDQKSGECLNGTYFWAKDMLLIERLDRPTIEAVIHELRESDLFSIIFSKIESTPTVWIFHSANSRFSGGVFNDLLLAEQWIKENRLTGLLTLYPLNRGVLDWAEEKGMVNMKKEKLALRKQDPLFIGGFTTASMDHHHYEDGEKMC